MILNQEIEDECENLGSQIFLSNYTLDDDTKLTTNNNSDIKYPFLRVGKPGKLFLQPNYSAFTKTNLGSIPSKAEKTLLRTEESVPITVSINKNIQKNISENPEIYKDPRSYTTSYSSKGYGVGFVSQVPRFNNNNKRLIYPGPGAYSPDKIISLQNNINKSIFGKSIFSEKTSKSLQLLTSIDNNNGYFSQDIIKKLKNITNNNRYSKNIGNDASYSEYYNDKNNKEDNNKGNYFFESKVKKFSGGLFNINNKNPGPGKYFVDINYKIKNKDKKSPEFMQPIIKKESPIKTFGLNDNDEKKIGFGLVDNKKSGKITTFWKGAPSFGFSYDFGKTIKNIKKSNYSDNNMKYNKNNMLNIPDNDVSNKLKKLGNMNYRKKNNHNDKNKGLSLSEERYNSKYDDDKKYKYDLIMKDLMKFRRKDFFGLSPPRWDEGLYHDNASHFQIPGPAYYQPIVPSTKRSFNINKKDFIFTNGVPFKEKKYSD
jgi:hypothetical protein